MLHLLLTCALSKEGGKKQSCQQLKSGEETSSECLKKLIVPVTCIKYRKANTENLDSQDSVYTLELKDIWGQLLHQITVTRSIKQRWNKRKDRRYNISPKVPLYKKPCLRHAIHHYTSHSAPAEEVMRDVVEHIEMLRGSTGLLCKVELYINDVLRLENEAALKLIRHC